MTLHVQRLVSSAQLPTRADPGAAGYDLSACLEAADGSPRESCRPGGLTIRPGRRAMIPTGLAIRVPDGTYGRIAPRSGLALKYGLDVLAGVVDQSYTGEVACILINLGHDPVTVAHGYRIAQLVLERIATPDVIEVAELAPTARGAGGFGSTGTGTPDPLSPH